MARGAFARVYVEVDLMKPLVPGCPVGSSEQETEFFQVFILKNWCLLFQIWGDRSSSR